MHAFARSLGGACQRRAQHHRIGAQRECLDEAAGITHTAVGNHLHIASARFVHVIAAGLGDIGDGSGHRRVHSNRVAVGGYRTATEADKHASGSRAHQMQRSRVVGRAANNDGDIQVIDEFLKVQGLMVLGDMLRRHHGATNDKQIDTGLKHGGIIILRTLRRQRAGYGDAGITNLMQTFDDEFRLDRLSVNLLDAFGGLVRRQLRDFVQQRLGIVIAGPQSF